MGVAIMNRGVLRNHPAGARRGNRRRTGGGQGGGRRGTGGVMVERAVMVEMTGLIDLANGADIPLTMDTYMPKVMAFKASLSVLGVGTRERGIDRYAMDSA